MSGILPDGILIGAPRWAWPALAAVVIIALIIAWNYAARARWSAFSVVAALLKLTAVLLVAFCLLEPLRTGTRPRPKANVLGVLVDDSQSMTIRDGRRGESLAMQLEDVVEPDAAWLKRLEQSFDLRHYSFGGRLRRVADFSTLRYDAPITSLASALAQLSERFESRPVAGLLLITDGNAVDSSEVSQLASSIPFPIYPVVSGEVVPPKDLRISRLAVTETGFETAPITIAASVTASGMDAGPVTVRVKNLVDGKVVHEQEIEGPKEGATRDVRIQLKPVTPGVVFYGVEAFRRGDAAAYESGSVRDEATLVNNRRLVAVDRGHGPYRVLYVAGRPNWEFKFLRRAASTDDEVHLVGLLRLANKEPKFSFRDSFVPETNRLFSGLGEDVEETAEQHDEPVLVRFGIDEKDQLSKGFPKTREELFDYQAIVLDDLEAEFFTQDQMMLLRSFVTDRGGGLMMLGGAESFSRESMANSILGDLSPVYLLSRRSDPLPDPLKYELTREGLLQPWLRLRSTEAAEQSRRAQLPSLAMANPIGPPKPGATVLATITDGAGRTQPGLVVQRFGRGRTAAMPVGDRWRWSMHRKPGDDDPAQSWRQFLRWLVSDVPQRIEVDVEQQPDTLEPVTIAVSVLDPKYAPQDNASVSLTIRRPDGTEAVLDAQPHAQSAGVYETSFQADQPGPYTVAAAVTAADGSAVGEARSGWTSDPGAAEFDRLVQNRQLLSELAEKTGGELIQLDQLSAFAEELPNRKVPVTESWVYPLWHRGWILFFAVGCLCGEWGIRRWRGLP